MLAPAISVDHALALSNDKAIMRKYVSAARFANRILIMRARQIDRGADILGCVEKLNSIWRSVIVAVSAPHFLFSNRASDSVAQHLCHRENASEIKSRSHAKSPCCNVRVTKNLKQAAPRKTGAQGARSGRHYRRIPPERLGRWLS